MRKVIGLLGILLLASGLAAAQDVKAMRLGDVARKVRAARAQRNLSQVPYFTNDTLPRDAAGISVLGASRVAVSAEGGEEGAAGGAAAGSEKAECDEQCWRGKFREKREQIATAQREFDILQREFNLARTQYYQDPNQAVREQYSGSTAGGRELQQLQASMDEKQAQIRRLQQELSGLEDELRRAGGNPGWARP